MFPSLHQDARGRVRDRGKRAAIKLRRKGRIVPLPSFRRMPGGEFPFFEKKKERERGPRKKKRDGDVNQVFYPKDTTFSRVFCVSTRESSLAMDKKRKKSDVSRRKEEIFFF